MLVFLIGPLVSLLFVGHAFPGLRVPIMLIGIVSVLGGLLTNRLIPIMMQYTLRRGLKGRDLGKKGTKDGEKDIPESLGIASGTVYLVCIILLQLLYHDNAPMLVNYNAALHSICMMLLLGFADDVLDVPWRYKMMIPFIGSLPLVVAYSGGTSILLPQVARGFFGGKGYIELGIFYRIYMVLLAVFCTNSINIFAGINGLEAGQSIVIAIFVVIHNCIELSSNSHEAHLLSLTLMIPFIGTTLALLRWNWYPARVFVGDTFTLFAGMTLAVCGILGHFSKTLLIFFLPQILNFLYSVPQLFGIVPCPRHRLPRFNVSTRKMEGVSSHMNLVNAFLLIFGSMSEESLCISLLCFQALCCALGLFVRYYVSQFFY